MSRKYEITKKAAEAAIKIVLIILVRNDISAVHQDISLGLRHLKNLQQDEPIPFPDEIRNGMRHIALLFPYFSEIL